MARNNKISTAGKQLALLAFAPDELLPAEPFKAGSKGLWIGFLGVAGLFAQLAFLVPKKFIAVGMGDLMDAVVNVALALVLAMLFVWAQFLLENGILLAFGMRGTSKPVMGSMITWLFLPVLALPLHGLFPLGMFTLGHGGILWSIIIVAISWHVLVLVTLLRIGHVKTTGGEPVPKKKLAAIAAVLIGVEVTLGIIFLIYIPLLFNSDFIRFAMEWRL